MLALAQLRRYRTLRDDGVPAGAAYRAATATLTSPRYRSGPGDTITFELDDPELAAFTITAHAEPDPMPDISWLGEFTDAWSPEAIENSRDPRVYCYSCPPTPWPSAARTSPPAVTPAPRRSGSPSRKPARTCAWPARSSTASSSSRSARPVCCSVPPCSAPTSTRTATSRSRSSPSSTTTAWIDEAVHEAGTVISTV